MVKIIPLIIGGAIALVGAKALFPKEGTEIPQFSAGGGLVTKQFGAIDTPMATGAPFSLNFKEAPINFSVQVPQEQKAPEPQFSSKKVIGATTTNRQTPRRIVSSPITELFQPERATLETPTSIVSQKASTPLVANKLNIVNAQLQSGGSKKENVKPMGML